MHSSLCVMYVIMHCQFFFPDLNLWCFPSSHSFFYPSIMSDSQLSSLLVFPYLSLKKMMLYISNLSFSVINPINVFFLFVLNFNVLEISRHYTLLYQRFMNLYSFAPKVHDSLLFCTKDFRLCTLLYLVNHD